LIQNQESDCGKGGEGSVSVSETVGTVFFEAEGSNGNKVGTKSKTVEDEDSLKNDAGVRVQEAQVQSSNQSEKRGKAEACSWGNLITELEKNSSSNSCTKNSENLLQLDHVSSNLGVSKRQGTSVLRDNESNGNIETSSKAEKPEV